MNKHVVECRVCHRLFECACPAPDDRHASRLCADCLQRLAATPRPTLALGSKRLFHPCCTNWEVAGHNCNKSLGLDRD